MSLVVVERTFAEPTSFAALSAAEARVACCLEHYRVRPLVSYQAIAGGQLVCMYEAPDAEAVRVTQVQGSLAFERIWCGEAFGSGMTPAADGKSVVVSLRCHPQPRTMQEVQQAALHAEGCMRMYRVQHHLTVLATDGLRQLCLFSAPDSEAVRLVHRDLGNDSASIWPAVVMLPPRTESASVESGGLRQDLGGSAGE